MANPSTEGGTGVGTEVLRRFFKCWSSASNNEVLLTGAANHIYTILSVFFCERGNAAELMSMYVTSSGPLNTHIFSSQPIGAKETFVWNDKFCIAGDDILYCGSDSTSSFDVYLSYIDQQFAAP